MKQFTYLSLLVCVAFCAATLSAQQLRFPQPSQGTKITQTIGITDVTITYSRPGVKGREIWGKLVPFAELWRTGANLATTIEFTDEVKIEGQKVPAGKYAVFSIPGKDEWTVILNKNFNQGGTASYKQDEDLLRVKVKPMMVTENKEWMEFTFESLTENSAMIHLCWEKLRLPIKLDVETKDLVLTKARTVVSWAPAMQIANYSLQNNTNLDEAMKMIDVSIAIQETYRNHVVKARLLDKAGKKADAAKVYEKAVTMGKAEKTAPFDLADVEKELAALKPAPAAKPKK